MVADRAYTSANQRIAQSFPVVPSIVHENAPRVIAEAHAVGMVVCASQVGGVPELLLSDDVMFTPTNEGLERALREMIVRCVDSRLCMHDLRPRG